MAALSCSGHDDVPAGFFEPFHHSAAYLGMDYLGYIHTWVEDDTLPIVVIDRLQPFAWSLL